MNTGLKLAAGGVLVAMAVGAVFSRMAMGNPKESTATIRLHHISPSDFLRQVASTPVSPNDRSASFVHPMLPSDIRQIDTDDTTGKLVISGGSDGIAQIRRIAHLLDIASPSGKVDISIVRSPMMPGEFAKGHVAPATRDGEIVGTGSVRVDNSQPVDVAIVADQHLFLAHLQPQVQAKGRLSIGVQLSSEKLGQRI